MARRRKLTRKQIAAGFGGKRRKRRRSAAPRRRRRTVARRRRRAPRRRRNYYRRVKNTRRGGKKLSVTLIALLLEAVSLLGLGGARADGVRNQLDTIAEGSMIPASTFLGVMMVLQVAAMFFPQFARKVNARLGTFGLKL